MRRFALLATVLAGIAAYAVFRAGGTVSNPAPGPSAPAWQRVDGLAGVPSSYAESIAGQGAVVEGAVYVRPGEGWMKFVSGFNPTAVKSTGPGIFLFGTVTAGRDGAPVLLQILPAPSDVVPVPCVPSDLAIRDGRGVLACDHRAYVSTDGLRTLAAIRPASVDTRYTTVAGSWVLRFDKGLQRLEDVSCADAAPCASREIPAGAVLGAVRLERNGHPSTGAGIALNPASHVWEALFVSWGTANGVARFGGPACSALIPDHPPDVVMPMDSVALYLCEGQLVSTTDRGTTFQREEGLPASTRVDALWGGDGWAAMVGGGVLYRRDFK